VAKIHVVGLTSLLAAAVTVGWLWRSPRPGSEPPVQQRTSSSRPAPPAPASPRAPSEYRPAAVAPRPPPEPTAAPEDAPGEQARAAPPPSPQGSWESEGRLNTWPREKAQDLRTLLDGSLPASAELRRFECRTSVCRAEVLLPDQAALVKYQHRLVIDPGNWPGAAEFTTEPQADGQILLVSYLAQND
jgi:hypothetical protein